MVDRCLKEDAGKRDKGEEIPERRVPLPPVPSFSPLPNCSTHQPDDRCGKEAAEKREKGEIQERRVPLPPVPSFSTLIKCSTHLPELHSVEAKSACDVEKESVGGVVTGDDGRDEGLESSWKAVPSLSRPGTCSLHIPICVCV